MNSRSTWACLRHRLPASAVFALACSAARACSGDIAISYLFSTEAELLSAPEGSFPDELNRLTRIRPVVQRAVVVPPEETSYRLTANLRPTSAAQDISDVRRAAGDDVADAYAVVRARLENWIQAKDRRRQKIAELEWSQPPGARVVPPEESLPDLALPAGLPAEFAGYFRGAMAWHQGRSDEARAAWEGVMALPEKERSHRSLWAAFMLGRLAAETSVNLGYQEQRARVADAQRWSRRARELAAQGFADPLGMAAASYGWEARALLHLEDFVGAIDLYLLQHGTGDPSALESLRRVARRAIYAPAEKLQALARDPNSRGVLTAYLVSRGRSLFSDQVHDSGLADVASRWGAALARAKVTDDVHADRIAWVAYEGGLFALAREWVDLARKESGIAEWIRAQLALRAGNLAEGEARLRGALEGEGLNEEQKKQAWGELARTCLAQDKPADALSAWLAGDHGADANYVAGRVMTINELKAYIDARPFSPMRGMLAKRLARVGRVDAAEHYYDERMQPVFRAYVADVRTGFDIANPADERARAFWRAAQTVREKGWELLGDELHTEYYPTLVESPADTRMVQARQDARLTGGIFATTPDELQRLETFPAVEKHFRHYRYRAAELAWWAAALLPNESDETAEILATAGGWLKARDPQAAQPFYQALVLRCGNTELGRAAARKRWFP